MANIRVVVLSGSVRPGNYTARAVALVMDALAEMEGVEATWIDPAGLTLGLPGQAVEGSSAAALQETVRHATGVVLATPEYHGSYSSALKLQIENLGFPSELSGKPVALLGVAAGAIGAIKALEHLRSVVSHIGGIVLPGPVSVAGVQGVFDEEGRCTEPGVEQRVRGVARTLVDYIQETICPRIALEAMVRETPS